MGNSEIIVKEMMNVLPPEWEKEVIQLNNLRIERCRACYACLPTDKPCMIDDDFNFFLSRIQAADKIIIAAPVYSLGQHTILKLINDRMISVLNKADQYFTGKQCVIVIPHSVEDWEGYAREATMHFARFFGLNITGTAVVRASLPSDVTEEKTLVKIRELALSLLDNSVINLEDPEKVYCPDCGSSLLQIFHKGKWRCVMCGSTGTWTTDSGEFTLLWDIPQHRRYALEGIQEHGERLNRLKQEFIQRRRDIAMALRKYEETSVNKERTDK
jgi:ribosomal protein S27AE